MLAQLVFLFALSLWQEPQTSQARYAEIVALQNRARQSDMKTRLVDQRESIEIAETLGRPRLTAVLYQRLGRERESENVQAAVLAYEAALRALAGAPGLDASAELDRITGMGKGFGGRSAPTPADLYSASLDQELKDAEANPALVPQLLIDIGNAYFSQPQLSLALDRYQAALARPELANLPSLRAFAMANSGEILRRQGSIDQAERMLRDALALLERHATPTDARRALVMLAGILRDRGQETEALAAYARALALYGQTSDVRGEGRAYTALGLLHLKAKRFQEAIAAYTRSIALSGKAADNLSLWSAHWGMGQAQRATGQIAAAVKSLQTSLALVEGGQRNLTTDEGKVTLLESAQDIFDELITLHLEQMAVNPANGAEALAVAERARGGAMQELMGGAGQRTLYCPPPVDPRADRKIPPQNNVTQMSMAQQSGAGISVTRPEILFPDPRCATGRDRARVTPPPLTRLVFHVLEDRTAIFVVGRKGEVLSRVVPFGRASLERRVADLRQALDVDTGGNGLTVTGAPAPESPNAYHVQARRLYDDLIAPISSAVPDEETVVIEPHGPLWLTPFAVLEDSAGRPLIDRWAILFSPSAQILEGIRSEPPFRLPDDLSALIIGNPTAPSVDLAGDARFRSGAQRASFQPLPGAEREAHAIGNLLPADRRQVLIGSAATLRTVEREAPRHTLIHLASHALAYAERPMDSFVMLAADSDSNGQLTARRVVGLPLHADLVTLSACQTGIGQLSGDGVIGLSRSFLARGARSVLVSQWSVSDTATAALMTSFYTRYLSAADDKALALRKAMNEVRALKEFSHPRFWAPFILIGSEK